MRLDPHHALTLALTLCIGPGCERASTPEPAPSWPAGTVLAVEDLPISADEVDLASAWVEPIDRKASPEHLRRLALTNVVLPNAIVRVLAPERREAALAEARATLEQLRAGTWNGPVGPDGIHGERFQGHFKHLGLAVWGTALTLGEGEWSEPIEEGGLVMLVRRLEQTEAPVPMATEFDVDLLSFPVLNPESAALEIEAAYDRLHLTIVDPSWRTIVPELIQYRMGVHRP